MYRFADMRLLLSAKGKFLYRNISKNYHSNHLWTNISTNMKNGEIVVGDVIIILAEIYNDNGGIFPPMALKFFPRQCGFLLELASFYEQEKNSSSQEEISSSDRDLFFIQRLELLLLIVDRYCDCYPAPHDDYIYTVPEKLATNSLQILAKHMNMITNKLDVKEYYGSHFHMSLFIAIRRKNRNDVMWILINGLIHAPCNPVTFNPVSISNEVQFLLVEIFNIMPLDELLVSWLYSKRITSPEDYFNRCQFLSIKGGDYSIMKRGVRLARQHKKYDFATYIISMFNKAN